MSKLFLYQILDIAATFSQLLIFYITSNTLCQKPRMKCSKWLALVILLAVAYFWTWVIADGTFKLPTILLIMIGVYLLCYKDSFYNIIIMVLMAMLFYGAAESIALAIADNLGFSTVVFVEKIAVVSIPIYLTCIIVNLVVSAGLYLIFRGFRYQLNKQDFIVVFIFELVAFLLFHIRVSLFADITPGMFYEKTDIVLIVIATTFAVVFLYLKNNYYLREQSQRDKMQIAQLRQQFNYYQDKLKDEERVRSIYHDLKNHLLVLESRQNYLETQQMVERLRSQIADYEDYVHTGNEFLDIILKDKAAKAREKQIDFSATVDFSRISFMEPLDISTIFGNAIDNAIEASEKLPENQRLITVKAERVRDMLIITIENNVIPEISFTQRTTKQDHFLHGYGIPNIKNAVENYGGQCSFQQTKQTFLLKILIPIP